MRRFDALVGTGGIGTGIVLELDGDATLGREESRAARQLDRRDYAKLHIIGHYVQRLLGPRFGVYPIGCVGADAAGTALRRQLADEGLDLRFVRSSAARPTLFAVSFVYPDGEGGNITSLAASATVGVEDVTASVPVLQQFGRRGIALAVPEVPLTARIALLDAATQHGLLRAASLSSGEIRDGALAAFLPRTDLLAINQDEAAAVLGRDAGDPRATALAAITELRDRAPDLQIVVTAGRHGGWSADAHDVGHAPALPVRPVSTAGAGDAHLAGLLVALTAGVDLHEANRFATVVSALKVRSPHTINDEITAAAVLDAAHEWAVPVPPALTELLREVSPLPTPTGVE